MSFSPSLPPGEDVTELSDSNLEEFLQDYSIVEARVIARSDEDYQTPGPLDVGSSTRSESFSFDQQDFDHNILELPETRGSAELRRDITAKINPESLQDLIRESQNLDDEAKLHNETETVGDIVNGYCRRYSVTTESIYSLILSSSGIDKESQAGIRKTTEWNAYQTLYKDELKEKYHRDPSQRELMKLLSNGYKETEVERKLDPNIGLMWKLKALHLRGIKSGEEEPGIRSVRASVQTVAEGMHTLVANTPPQHAVRAVTFVWSALPKIKVNNSDCKVLVSHQDLVTYYKCFAEALNPLSYLNCLVKFTQCAYAVGEAAALAAKTISTGLLTFKASREPDLTAVRKLLMGDNKELNLMTHDEFDPNRRASTPIDLDDDQVTPRPSKGKRKALSKLVKDQPVKRVRIEGLASSPVHDTPETPCPNHRRSRSIHSADHVVPEETGTVEAPDILMFDPVKETMPTGILVPGSDIQETRRTTSILEDVGTSNLEGEGSGSGEKNIGNRPPEFGEPLTLDERKAMGAVWTGAEIDYKDLEAGFGPQNWDVIKQHKWTTGGVRTANLKKLEESPLLQKLASHPASLEIKDFLLGPEPFPVDFSFDMLPTPASKVGPGASLHPPLRKGREGCGKSVTEPSPFPACPWAALMVPSVQKSHLRTAVSKSRGFAFDKSTGRSYPEDMENLGRDIVNVPGHMLPWTTFDQDLKVDTWTLIRIKDSLLCPDPRDRMIDVSRHHYDDAGLRRPGFINYMSGGDAIRYYHGFSNGIYGTDRTVRPSHGDCCKCGGCRTWDKMQWAGQVRSTFEPESCAMAVPVAYEAVLYAIEHPSEYPGINELPFTKEVLSVVARHKKNGITPEQSPAYLACWKAASARRKEKGEGTQRPQHEAPQPGATIQDREAGTEVQIRRLTTEVPNPPVPNRETEVSIAGASRVQVQTEGRLQVPQAQGLREATHQSNVTMDIDNPFTTSSEPREHIPLNSSPLQSTPHRGLKSFGSTTAGRLHFPASTTILSPRPERVGLRITQATPDPIRDNQVPGDMDEEEDLALLRGNPIKEFARLPHSKDVLVRNPSPVMRTTSPASFMVASCHGNWRVGLKVLAVSYWRLWDRYGGSLLISDFSRGMLTTSSDFDECVREGCSIVGGIRNTSPSDAKWTPDETQRLVLIEYCKFTFSFPLEPSAIFGNEKPSKALDFGRARALLDFFEANDDKPSDLNKDYDGLAQLSSTEDLDKRYVQRFTQWQISRMTGLLPAIKNSFLQFVLGDDCSSWFTIRETLIVGINESDKELICRVFGRLKRVLNVLRCTSSIIRWEAFGFLVCRLFLMEQVSGSVREYYIPDALMMELHPCLDLVDPWPLVDGVKSVDALFMISATVHFVASDIDLPSGWELNWNSWAFMDDKRAYYLVLCAKYISKFQTLRQKAQRCETAKSQIDRANMTEDLINIFKLMEENQDRGKSKELHVLCANAMLGAVRAFRDYTAFQETLLSKSDPLSKQAGETATYWSTTFEWVEHEITQDAFKEIGYSF